MGRSNYCDDIDNWQLICWRGAVKKALTGKRGQAALKELLAALDAMPTKRLIANDLVRDGEYCTLGVLGASRGISMDDLDPYEADVLAEKFNLSEAMIREIEYENDEHGETPEQRWQRMRNWVVRHIQNPPQPRPRL